MAGELSEVAGLRTEQAGQRHTVRKPKRGRNLDAKGSPPHTDSCALQILGHSDSLAYEAWPALEEQYLVSDTFKLPVQVRPLDNGNSTFTDAA